MTGRYFRTILTVFLLLVVASPSFAARRSSLSGNLLIQDIDDMFFFPHLVAMNKRMVTFDFGTNSGLGSGGMVFGGEKFTVGLFSHRSDFLGSLQDAFNTRGDIDNIGNGGAIDVGVGPNALNWIDLLAGWEAMGNPWGVRFSVSRNNLDDPDPNIQSDVTGFNVVVGTRLQRWGATDASVEFSWASANDETGLNAKTESSPVHFGLGVRHTAGEESDALRLGWLGQVAYSSGSADQTAGTLTSTIDFSNVNVVVGAGPVYKPNDRTNVAMYGTFEYNRDKTEGPAGGAGINPIDTHTTTALPGWNVAAEVEVASWLQFRSGLRSHFVFFDEKHEGTGGADTEEKNNTLSFDWTTGLGLRWGNFTVDGYLDPSVITTGTDLLGNGNQLFALVSTTLRF